MNKEFHEKVNQMFESSLYYKGVPSIRIKSVKEDKILDNIDYGRIRFDASLNIYKIQNDGSWKFVFNENFKPVIIEE